MSFTKTENIRWVVQNLGIVNEFILRTDFIADSEVKYYLSAADFVIQPYRNATQSGVTPSPIISKTHVGNDRRRPSRSCSRWQSRPGLEPEPSSIASHILKLYELEKTIFAATSRREKEIQLVCACKQHKRPGEIMFWTRLRCRHDAFIASHLCTVG